MQLVTKFIRNAQGKVLGAFLRDNSLPSEIFLLNNSVIKNLAPDSIMVRVRYGT
jgi:hypothetical protein